MNLDVQLHTTEEHKEPSSNHIGKKDFLYA